MSAFIVSHKHIDALVSAMLDARMSYWDGHNRVYVTRAPKPSDVSCSRKTCAQSCTATVAGWGTTKNRPRIHIALLMPQGLGRRCNIKAVHCLDYQSCETEDWETTLAWRICQALLSSTTARLPGYEAAAWEIVD
jgi:hypothetical protein